MKISSEWPLSFSFHTVWFNSEPPQIVASKMTKTCDSPSLQFVRQWNTGMYDILQVCNHIIQHLHGQRLTLNLPYSKCYFAMIVHNGFYIWMFDSPVLFPIFLVKFRSSKRCESSSLAWFYGDWKRNVKTDMQCPLPPRN